MGYIIFHGVGGDSISADLPAFIAFLDQLDAKRDQVWVTAHIPAHKYETEQATAAAQMQQATNTKIRLTLICKAAPKAVRLSADPEHARATNVGVLDGSWRTEATAKSR